MTRDFSGLADVAAYTEKAEQLKATKEVKAGWKQFKTEAQTQQRYVEDFLALREQWRIANDRAAMTANLRSFIANVRRRAEGETNNAERLAARRTLGHLFIALLEDANLARHSKKYAEAAASLTWASEVRPDNPNILFALARAAALSGDKKRALEALQKAVAKGWKDADELRRQPDFTSIRNELGFQRLIEQLTGAPHEDAKPKP